MVHAWWTAYWDYMRLCINSINEGLLHSSWAWPSQRHILEFVSTFVQSKKVFFPFEVNFLILSLWFWYAYVSISLGCLCCVGLLFTLSDCWGCFCKRALMHSESVQDWQQLKRRKKNQQLSATSGDYISTLFCATSWMQLGNHVSVK